MTSTTVFVCFMLLLFTSNISAEIFHHRDVRQVGYGYNNGYNNNGYDSNRYDTGYGTNGYNNGYGNNGYNNNQYDQMPRTTTSSSYLKNGLKGAAVGALAAGAYTWWKNGK
uniref:Uncharacterized protein n=1 Tax=Panagrolaimus sp. ES5 TaxID=591445 RepID=A0AC34FBL5_9BILA